MKRSEINAAIRAAQQAARTFQFQLPPFAHWSPADWEQKGADYNEIRHTMLGWDVTDFGEGDFSKTGLVLFTLRNGSLQEPGYSKPYAEKVMWLKNGQVVPWHFHWQKMEDIINRGGGDMLVQVCQATDEEEMSEDVFSVSIDGRKVHCHPLDTLRLSPGESITLPTRLYHQFWVEALDPQGQVLLGEVSQVNDDKADNRFRKPLGRFPTIVEDEPALQLLCNEYPHIK